MTESTATVELSRIIEAPAEAVFRAWIDPAVIAKWFAPHLYEVGEASFDARVGGKYDTTVVGPDGDVHRTSGEYLELDPPRRLKKTWKYEGPHGDDRTPSLLTVELREIRPGVTELSLKHERLRDGTQRRDAVDGWTSLLEKLDALCAKAGASMSRERRELLSYGAGAFGLSLLARRAARAQEGTSIRITLSGVFVEDQERALRFYTEKLGLLKKEDVPVGAFRWLTVVSPSEPDGTELLLEPNDNEAAKTYQKSIYEQGIPATALEASDVRREHQRLVDLGVSFRVPPTEAGDVTIVVFDDTCGNWIQLYQK